MLTFTATPALEFTEITSPERSRTYIFPAEEGPALYEMKIEGVVRVCARPSGAHRLETADGSKYIVPAGWLAIKIDADAWSF